MKRLAVKLLGIIALIAIVSQSNAEELQVTSPARYDRFARKLVEHGLRSADRITQRNGEYSLYLGLDMTPPPGSGIVDCYFVYKAPFAHFRLRRADVPEEVAQSILEAWLRDWADEKAGEYSLVLTASEADKLSAAAGLTAKRIGRQISSLRVQWEKQLVTPPPGDPKRWLAELSSQLYELIDLEESLVGKQLESIRAAHENR